MMACSGRKSVDLAPQRDIGWNYAAPHGDSKKPQCIFCDKIIMGGGITRLKQHLVGGYRNVAKCTRIPEKERKIVQEAMEGKKTREVEKARKDALFRERLFGHHMLDIDDSDEDEGYNYPPDVVTPQERRQFRQAMRDSVRTEHERQQEQEFARGRPYYEVGSGSGAGAHASGAKKKKTEGGQREIGRSLSMRYEPPKDKKQRTLKGMLGSMRERVGKAISTFFFAHSIPANVAKGPFLRHMIDEIAQAGPGVSAPSAADIMGTYLPAVMADVGEYIEGLKKMWPDYGVTIMADGWTSFTRRQIVNFLAYCDGKTVFLKSVDASDKVKDAKYIYKLLVEVVQKVGPENVVQIVTDNGTNFKKAGEMLQADDRFSCFWTPCAAHSIDLMLKDFGKRKAIGDVVSDARTITTFIYNHSHLLSMMRKNCEGELVRPGITRFATNFIALQSILSNKAGLKRMFTSTQWSKNKESKTSTGKRVEELVLSSKFWDACARACRIMEPVVQVLRMVDGDKKPTMPSIYMALGLMKEKVRENAGRAATQYMNIINDRWDAMLSLPIHKAGE